MDVANFCVMEFTFPSFANAFFKATDTEGSPGLIAPDGNVTHTGDPTILAHAKERREIRRAREGD
jgi:hypothetical protein